mmetsp:Transcript_16810/g.42931  ORF Transcript_16810/g.42931 Transcript_16810/m.42931 type:complete len:310 (-) Transcript_16810:96-1025(-)|eukprot:CAMPEP_0177651642 /NCGR_PEP_ID=MMETSP0447-20121125/12671_1 /TAXON_ID=0 /ORGANISM="Stygamoeba regulata, Strain BSH-02190019" /LENGTH=309 /DNA_ID=CAMNT_0019154765 /DNA_START=41 /DNA_END=970 /DNA_ORIENTATION=+
MADELTKLFAQFGLDKYAEKLIEAGVDDAEMLGELTEEDLVEMGVPKIRARSAVKKIAEAGASGAGASTGSSGKVEMPTDFTAAAKANKNWSQFSLEQKKRLVNAYENCHALGLRLREITGNPDFVVTLDASNALLQPPYHEELLKHWRKENALLTPSDLLNKTMRQGGKGDWCGVTDKFLAQFGRPLDECPLTSNNHIRGLLYVIEKACEDSLSKDNFNETIDRIHYCWDHPDNGPGYVNFRSYQIGKTALVVLNDHSPKSECTLNPVYETFKTFLQEGGPAKIPRCCDGSGRGHAPDLYKYIDGFGV